MINRMMLQKNTLKKRHFNITLFSGLAAIGCLAASSSWSTPNTPPQNAVTVQAEKYERGVLNLKDVDIRVFIEEVGKITGKTFIIDPRVKGNVTVISTHAVDLAEVNAIFESTLRVHGFAAVETGPVTKIVQDIQAKGDGVPVITGDDISFNGDKLVTRVVKLNNVDVGALVPVLRTLIPQQGHLAPYKPTNVIVLHDRASNIKRMVNIIRQVDRASDNEIDVIRLKHAAAGETARLIKNLVGSGKKGAAEVVADDRTNSLLLSSDANTRLKLRTIIAHLDTPLESKSGNTQVVYLKYTKAETLVEVLKGVSKTISNENKENAAKTSSSSKKRDNVSIEAHQETNAIVMTAPQDIMRALESVIRQLDIPRAQVHVDAIIVEITDRKAKELGIQWLFPGSKNGDVAPVGFSNFTSSVGINQVAAAAAQAIDQDGNLGDQGQALGQLLGGIEGLGFGIGRFKDNGLNFAALIRALGTVTDANILSTPSITTLDNQEASILVGQEVAFASRQAVDQTNNQNLFNNIERQKVGIKLKLIPQINEGDKIRMEIEQEVSDVIGASGLDRSTNTREIKTTVMVADGGMIVLGGLIEDKINESESKVPLLGDLPLLGYLFRSQITTKTKSNLMIFLRPQILRDDKTIYELSYRKYSAMRAQQRKLREQGISLMPEETAAVLPEIPSPNQNDLPPKPAQSTVTSRQTPLTNNGVDWDEDFND